MAKRKNKPLTREQITEIKNELMPHLREFREIVEKQFGAETSRFPPEEYETVGSPGHGHDAAVAILAYLHFHGDLRGVRFGHNYHFFNHINGLDVDLMGDRFGDPTIRCDDVLYAATDTVDYKDLDPAVLEQTLLLAEKTDWLCIESESVKAMLRGKKPKRRRKRQ